MARVLFPSAGTSDAALRAGSVLGPVLGDIVPGAADEQRAAAWAAGVRAVAVDIPFIHIVHAGFPRDLPCAMQGFRRSLRLVAELEGRMKRRGVQRNRGTPGSHNPLRDLPRPRPLLLHPVS